MTGTWRGRQRRTLTDLFLLPPHQNPPAGDGFRKLHSRDCHSGSGCHSIGGQCSYPALTEVLALSAVRLLLGGDFGNSCRAYWPHDHERARPTHPPTRRRFTIAQLTDRWPWVGLRQDVPGELPSAPPCAEAEHSQARCNQAGNASTRDRAGNRERTRVPLARKAP